MSMTEQNIPWDTTRLYPSGTAPELDEDFAAIASRAKGFRLRYFGKAALLEAEEMKEALAELENIREDMAKPCCYAHLLFAQDSGNPDAKRLSQRSMEMENYMERELLFFELELLELEDDRYLEFLSEPVLANYGHYLESLRRYRPHTLPEREERLLKQKKLAGVEAFSRLFDELSSSFEYDFTLDGKERKMTGEELLGLLHHPDARVREDAYDAFLARYEENSIVFSSVINNVALDHSQELELRTYRYPMEPTHLANELPPGAVERLMAVTEEHYPLAREYFRLKARLLDIPILKNTDLYAPLSRPERAVTFDEAMELSLEAYGAFSPMFREIAAEFRDEGRIDIFPRTGKSGGAFCMGISPSQSPYVLLNFTGNRRDAATLAHELGHGIHYSLSQRQSMLNYHAPLPLAETASVFGEILLTRLLLEREKDPKEKTGILCAAIEDIIATTFRQNVLTRFEERLHTERKKGLPASSEICHIWLEENEKLYGDSVEMIPRYQWGWSYIPHFIHSRFYCYSYVFAELLVLSLYERYRAEGPAFVPIFTSILESGGSMSPAKTLSLAGIDLSDEDFWRRGYGFLREMLDELKGLLEGEGGGR